MALNWYIAIVHFFSSNNTRRSVVIVTRVTKNCIQIRHINRFAIFSPRYFDIKTGRGVSINDYGFIRLPFPGEIDELKNMPKDDLLDVESGDVLVHDLGGVLSLVTVSSVSRKCFIISGQVGSYSKFTGCGSGRGKGRVRFPVAGEVVRLQRLAS